MSRTLLEELERWSAAPARERAAAAPAISISYETQNTYQSPALRELLTELTVQERSSKQVQFSWVGAWLHTAVKRHDLTNVTTFWTFVHELGHASLDRTRDRAPDLLLREDPKSCFGVEVEFEGINARPKRLCGARTQSWWLRTAGWLGLSDDDWSWSTFSGGAAEVFVAPRSRDLRLLVEAVAEEFKAENAVTSAQDVLRVLLARLANRVAALLSTITLRRAASMSRTSTHERVLSHTILVGNPPPSDAPVLSATRRTSTEQDVTSGRGQNGTLYGSANRSGVRNRLRSRCTEARGAPGAVGYHPASRRARLARCSGYQRNRSLAAASGSLWTSHRREMVCQLPLVARARGV